MLKKLMSGIVIGSIVLSMVGCTDTKESTKQQIEDTSNSTRQEQQVQPKKEEVKKQQPKEEVKKDTTKKEQNDNIDPETGLAKVKHGKHLQEEADKQDEDYGIWTKDYCPECQQPMDDCICDGDTEDNNLNDVQQYQCSNCGDYYTEGAEHTCTSQYTDYEGNTVVETWKNGQMVDTTTIYNNDAEPDEFNNEDTEEY